MENEKRCCKCFLIVKHLVLSFMMTWYDMFSCSSSKSRRLKTLNDTLDKLFWGKHNVPNQTLGPDMYEFRRSPFAGKSWRVCKFRCQTCEKSSSFSSFSSWHLQRSLQSASTMFYFPSPLPSAPMSWEQGHAHLTEVRLVSWFCGHTNFCVGMALGQRFLHWLYMTLPQDVRKP